MAMSKRHFEAVAAVFDKHGKQATGSERRLLEQLADDLATEFYGENPRFDRGRFMRACGLD